MCYRGEGKNTQIKIDLKCSVEKEKVHKTHKMKKYPEYYNKHKITK